MIGYAPSRSKGAVPFAKLGAALAVVALAFVSVLALPGCAEREAADTETVGPANPPFFEIVGPDGSVEGWMLGTIHALPDGVEWRTPAIQQAIEEADYLLLEVAGLDDRAGIAATFAQLSRSHGLQPLAERVDPDLRDEVEEMIDRSGQGAAALHMSEDWAAAILLSRVDAPGKPANGVDRAVLADFAGRDVQGFETAAEQLSIFDALAEEDQRVLLEETVREWIALQEKPRTLIQSYLSGDLEALEQKTTTGIMADAELREALLVGRNRRWMGNLLPRLQQAPRPLIAVGAAHLVGPDGLPAMLEARGYTIRLAR